MSGYESPSPEDEVAGGNTGSATGGGSPGDQDDMGTDDPMTVDEGAGRPQSVEETDSDEQAQP